MARQYLIKAATALSLAPLPGQTLEEISHRASQKAMISLPSLSGSPPVSIGGSSLEVRTPDASEI